MITNYRNLLFFDLETTGLDYKKDRIIEIGIYNLIKTKKGIFELDKEVNYLVKYDGKLSEKIIELTNITDEMLRKKGIEEYKMVNEFISNITDDTLLIAYNTQFDLNFITQAIRRTFKKPKYSIKCNMLDVMAFYKDWYKYPHKLESAIKELKITNASNSHRALDDAKATYQVLRKLFQIEEANFDDYINVFGYNPKYGVNYEIFKEITYTGQYGGSKEIKKYNDNMKGKMQNVK